MQNTKRSSEQGASRKYEIVASSFGNSAYGTGSQPYGTVERRVREELEAKYQEQIRLLNEKQAQMDQQLTSITSRQEQHAPKDNQMYEDLLTKYNELLYRFNKINLAENAREKYVPLDSTEPSRKKRPLE